MRIVWHSNAPWANTGYGQQTAIFTPRVRDLGHDVAISAMWGLGGSMLEYDGMPVYPADEKWGNLTLPRIAQEWGAGEDALVITLLDVWVLESPSLAKLWLAAWTPVDHEPTPPKVREFFERTGARSIAMSRFGQRMLRECGVPAGYVPHGIDTSTFKPQPDAREEVRELLGIPKDAFVVGMNANNKGTRPPRKAFPQVFQAFADLATRHDDAYLFLHCELSGRHDGINLGQLAVACGVPTERIKATPPWRHEIGVTQEELAALYAGVDVLANPSYGEGFGIPIIEAQACGVPVIVTNFSSMPELVGAGWTVGGDRWYDATQGAFFCCPSIMDIREAMFEAYEHRGDEKLGQRARAHALEYDADTVMREHFIPTLQELEAERQQALEEQRPLTMKAAAA